MNISELFEKLQNDISNDFNGELILEGNCIIWSYDIDRNGMAVEEKTDDDEEVEFDFNTVKSSEELLQQAYDEDLLSIESCIDIFDEYGDWSFSDPEIGETVISFKIF